jgi:hypothetical protein
MTTPVSGLPVGRTVSGQLILQRYQVNQQHIATRVAVAIHNLWLRIITPAVFEQSWETLNPIANGIISTHYEMAAADAAQYYTMSRIIAAFPHIDVPGLQPDEEYINRVVNAMGLGQYRHFIKNYSPEDSSAKAQDALRGASTRMVMMGGRDTIVRAAKIDPVAHGWERVIEPGACSFCAMLAGRGGVYSEATADFKAHDHCHCVARPVFAGQKSVNADLSEEWGRATKGTRGAAARAAWDKYWSSRGEHQGTQNPTEEGAGPASLTKESVGRSAIPNQAANR